jgi:hypothetical protein
MAKEENLRVNIIADKKKLDQGLNEAQSKIKGFAQAAMKAFVALGAAMGVRQLLKFGSESTKLADQQLQNERKLLVALNNRRDAQQRLILQAQQLQKKTRFGDEATIEAQGLLAVLGLTEDQIKSLTPLIQDMATGLGLDLKTASTLVGKSITTTTDALSRYFGTGLEGVIGQSQRAAVLTDTLTTKFKGQAQAMAETGRGPVVQLTNAWGDYREMIGGKVLPIINRLAKAATRTLENMTKESMLLLQQKTRLNTIVESITAVNITNDVRNDLIKQLRDQYPDFLESLTDETTTNETLVKRLKEVNQQYDQRIKLAIQQELITRKSKEIADSIEKEISLRQQLSAQENQLQRTQKLISQSPVASQELLRAQQFHINQIDRINKGIEKQQRVRERLNETIQETTALIGSYNAPDATPTGPEPNIGANIIQNPPLEKIESLKAGLIEVSDASRTMGESLHETSDTWASYVAPKWQALINMTDVVQGAFVDMGSTIGESLGDVLTETGNFGESIKQMLYDVAKSIGRVFISIGSGMALIPSQQAQGLALIAKGIALTTIGQVGGNLIAQSHQSQQQETNELTVAKIDNRYIYLAAQKGQRNIRQIT